MAANFLHSTDLGSDTDDEDYQPEEDEKRAAELSEEEDEDHNARKAGKADQVEQKAEEDAQEKKRIDDLWADFKKDVGTKTRAKPSASGPGLGALAKGPSDSASSSSKVQAKPSGAEKKPGAPDTDAKVTITKVFDFAGENVEVSKEVDKDSKEARKFLKEQEQKSSPSSSSGPPKRSGGGLSGLMSVITGKKQKMSCLEKSKMDWDKFVSEEGIQEDLQTHNKGKDGFVEKQDFLARSDLRRFELEREAREKTRRPLNR